MTSKVCIGPIFGLPLLGAAMGAAIGALNGLSVDLGIDDTFIKDTRDKIVPGTSTLFVLSSGAITDRVLDAFKRHRGRATPHVPQS